MIREAFLDTLSAFAALVAEPRVVAAWDRDSALADYTVGALVGHVISSSGAVLRYLDAEAAAGPARERTAYVGALTTSTTPELHAGVRSRGAAIAADGPDRARAELEGLHDRLDGRLADEPSDRLVTVAGGMTMRLDDYLETRIVELAVHFDDVAVSVGSPATVPVPATTIAVDHLLAVARATHGDRAVLIALTRRERDEAGALRVL